MAIEDLPRPLAHRLVEVAANVRVGNLVALEDGRLSGEEIEFLASDLIREGFGTPAAEVLIAPPRFRSLTDVLPLFERLLAELGCPSVDDLAAWWPEVNFDKRYPVPANVAGWAQDLWITLSDSFPSFRAKYELYETDYYNSIVFAQEFVRLLDEARHDPELRDTFAVLVRRRKDERVEELIGTMIFDCLVRNLADAGRSRVQELGATMAPDSRLVWQQLNPL